MDRGMEQLREGEVLKKRRGRLSHGRILARKRGCLNQ